MQPEERDRAHLWDMLSAAREVGEIVGEMPLEEFQSELIVMRATERCIEIIGEAARRISDRTRKAYPEIPWSDIIGQRNILAHEYGQIDYELLHKTAIEDVPHRDPSKIAAGRLRGTSLDLPTQTSPQRDSGRQSGQPCQITSVISLACCLSSSYSGCNESGSTGRFFSAAPSSSCFESQAFFDSRLPIVPSPFM